MDVGDVRVGIGLATAGSVFVWCTGGVNTVLGELCALHTAKANVSPKWREDCCDGNCGVINAWDVYRVD